MPARSTPSATLRAASLSGAGGASSLLRLAAGPAVPRAAVRLVPRPLVLEPRREVGRQLPLFGPTLASGSH